MRVSVFGGTHTRPGEKDYDEAVRLGRLLGERGCTVITGGFIDAVGAAAPRSPAMKSSASVPASPMPGSKRNSVFPTWFSA